MNEFLKANGIRESKLEVPQNKEFVKVSESLELDEDYSTFDSPRYISVINYLVAFNSKLDAVAFVKSVLDKLRDEAGLTTGTADIQEADSGFEVELIFNKREL